jgi:hypothetical protein
MRGIARNVAMGCWWILAACDGGAESTTPPPEKRDVKADAKGDVKGDAKADAEADAKGDAKADAEGDAKGDAEADAETGSVTREGVLEYKELPRTRSVAAYMGVEFTLKAEGEETVLAASKAVSRETLIEQHGKRIKVKCTLRAPEPPDPRSQYPTGPDGAPLQRPTTCVVDELVP